MIGIEPLSHHELVNLPETFRLLGDPSRLRILLHCTDAPKSVTQIADDLDLSQSLVSHHLRLLRGARLVRGVRQSRHIFYRISDQHVNAFLIDMIAHIREEHCYG